MEVPDAAGVELTAQLRRDRRGDQLARGRKIVEPFEQVVEPPRDARATGLREAARRRDVRNRQDAWNDLGIDTRGFRFVAEQEKAVSL
jgi:hypothetical protein